MAQKALNTESLHVHDIQTPIGAVHAAFSENGLCYLGFHDQEKNPLATFLKKNNLTQDSASSSFLAQTQKDLSDFFDGNFSSPRTPIDLRGTDFQKRVWAACLISHLEKNERIPSRQKCLEIYLRSVPWLRLMVPTRFLCSSPAIEWSVQMGV